MRTNRRLLLNRWLVAGLAGAALLVSPLGATALAQDPAQKDEALEKLLEKLKGPIPAVEPDAPKTGEGEKKPEVKPDAKPTADAPKTEPARPGDASKPGETPKSAEPAQPALPGGEVAGKDQSLDKLLEGLGETVDKPQAEGKKPQPPAGSGDESKPDQPPPPSGSGEGKDKEQEKPNQDRSLDQIEKKLDQRLEELTGRKPQKKEGDKKQGQGQGQGPGEGGEDEDKGPLGDLVKQMRDVEERLSKPDTGEGTRQKQTEILKRLDTMLQEARNGGGSGRSMLVKGSGKPGGKPQPGQGNQAGAEGVGASKPTPPRTPPALVEQAKAIWGQLPASVRDDMTNVLKESPLPNKADMIRLYYLSLSKKSTAGGN